MFPAICQFKFKLNVKWRKSVDSTACIAGYLMFLMVVLCG